MKNLMILTLVAMTLTACGKPSTGVGPTAPVETTPCGSYELVEASKCLVSEDGETACFTYKVFTGNVGIAFVGIPITLNELKNNCDYIVEEYIKELPQSNYYYFNFNQYQQ